MAQRDVIVIGTSTGGIDALTSLLAGLPGDLKSSIFIVMHTGPDSPGALNSILSSASKLPTSTPVDREPIQPGHIYLAPPDYHLLVDDGRICLSKGPKENRFRPAIDPLFRSAAAAYRCRVIGVVLTGGLDDGTAGLWAIKKLGGTTVVQDPDDAVCPSMPRSALRYVDVDHISTIREMAALLVRLTESQIELEEEVEVPQNLDLEVKIAKQDPAIELNVREVWDASSYTCPDCHGVLLLLEEGSRKRFRCHTGHAYSADSLLSGLSDQVEESLWATIRKIEESALLMRHLASHLMDHGASQQANEFSMKADEAQQNAKKVRLLVIAHDELSFDTVTSK